MIIIVGAALRGRPSFPTVCFRGGAATEGRPYCCVRFRELLERHGNAEDAREAEH